MRWASRSFLSSSERCFPALTPRAASAAPTMPAWLRISAGTTSASTRRWGRKLSCSSLTPPPRMNSAARVRSCTCRRYSPSRSPNASHSSSSSLSALPDACLSAFSPRTSMSGNSTLGTSTPSSNTATPSPVPMVTTMTLPSRPRPAPKTTSASPAASASFSTATGCPVAPSKSAAASMPTQDSSTLTAVCTTQSLITAGKATPMGPCQSKRRVISATTPAMASGVAGSGVSISTGSVSSEPSSVSTGAPLMSVAPMSIPRIFIVRVSCWAVNPRRCPVYRADCGARRGSRQTCAAGPAGGGYPSRCWRCRARRGSRRRAGCACS